MTTNVLPMPAPAPAPAPGLPTPSRRPTNKWFAVLISGVFTIGAHAIGSGGWDAAEWAELLTLCAGLTMSYATPNDPTPGGVPDRTESAAAA